MAGEFNEVEVVMLTMSVQHYSKCVEMTAEQKLAWELLLDKVRRYGVPFVSPETLAALLGKRGGQVTSKAKAKAVRENGKLGGRPASTLFCWECAPPRQDPDNARLIDVSANRYYQGKPCSACNEQAHYRLGK